MGRVFFAPEVTDGDFLGDYQVLNPLGRGTLGTSYHVVNHVLGREFALKSLKLTRNISLEWLDRLEAQTALLGKLVHPNIDHIMNSGRSGRMWFCLKDFVHDGEGESCNLRTYMDQHGGRLSHYQAFHITLQILQALKFAAAYEDANHQGIHHGNLKPENILVAFGGDQSHSGLSTPFEVKVGDFQPYALLHPSAILESYSQWQKSLSNFSARISTKANGYALSSIFRTYDYLAPEQNLRSSPTLASDLYSLGILMYEMLSGDVPAGIFPSISEIRPELSAGWDELISRCLHQKPEKRYPHFEIFEEALLDRLGEEGDRPQARPEVKKGAKKPPERRTLTPPGMTWIPAGEFWVGGSEAGDDALPQHMCSTRGFYMDRHPVTYEQFRRFVLETGYESEAEGGLGAPIWANGQWKVLSNVSWKDPQGCKLDKDLAKHPVTQITFTDAQAYAEWLGRRLPTEEEWEYAARGGQKDVLFPWGNHISKTHAHFSSDATCDVMSYQANGYGLYDMAGNVWEWTDSWYKAYPGNHQHNPHFGEKYRVVRGGAWMYDGAHCLISFRNANLPEHCYPTLGFRTVQDPPLKPRG